MLLLKGLIAHQKNYMIFYEFKNAYHKAVISIKIICNHRLQSPRCQLIFLLFTKTLHLMRKPRIGKDNLFFNSISTESERMYFGTRKHQVEQKNGFRINTRFRQSSEASKALYILSNTTDMLKARPADITTIKRINICKDSEKLTSATS